MIKRVHFQGTKRPVGCVKPIHIEAREDTVGERAGTKEGGEEARAESWTDLPQLVASSLLIQLALSAPRGNRHHPGLVDCVMEKF